MQLVILAAGMGSRFGGLKQMEPMDEYGNFLLDYSVYDAKMAGFSSVIFVIKKDFYEDFKNTIGARVSKIIPVHYVFQDLHDLPTGYLCPSNREKPWGTAHALYAARKEIHEDFVIINGDDFYGRKTYEIALDFLAKLPNDSKGRYANVAFSAENTMTENGSVKRGVAFEDDNGMLSHLVESQLEKKDGKIIATPLTGDDSFQIPSDQPVSMNLFCFSLDFLAQIEKRFPTWLDEHLEEEKSEYLLPAVVDEMVQQGLATTALLKSPEVWFGVTYKEDKPNVVASLKKLVDQGVYKKGIY